jgi:23S rRNA pseudouridine1911/1915/1917 synthase
MNNSENTKNKLENLLADTSEKRLDSWLADKISGYSRTYLTKLITEGKVLVNGNVIKPNYKIKLGDQISVEIPPDETFEILPEKNELDIIYEDADIIVVNKPKGMVVHPAAGNLTGTLVNALINHCGDSLSDINGDVRPGIVHRLDKDTTGILVAAKNNSSHKKLIQLFKSNEIVRVYVALVNGVIKEEKATVDAPIGRHPTNRKKMSVNTENGKRAITHFTVTERFKDATLVELRLETGRTHQIRVHMSYISHPVIGDPVYGRKGNAGLETEGQVLHAQKLAFPHPSTGEYMEFEAELPQYFKDLIKKQKSLLDNSY